MKCKAASAWLSRQALPPQSLSASFSASAVTASVIYTEMAFRRGCIHAHSKLCAPFLLLAFIQGLFLPRIFIGGFFPSKQMCLLFNCISVVFQGHNSEALLEETCCVSQNWPQCCVLCCSGFWRNDQPFFSFSSFCSPSGHGLLSPREADFRNTWTIASKSGDPRDPGHALSE